MKKNYLFLILSLSVLSFSLKPQTVAASQAAAGELYYEWISDSTYRFFFKYYQDCSATEPTTMPLCFYNTCLNTGFNTTMVKFSPTGFSQSFSCPGSKSKCDSPASTIQGVRQWLYYAMVTMPAQCSAWKVYTYTGPRNASLNLQNPTSSAFCSELMMNNTAGIQGNSSPYYSLQPWIYVCVNNPFPLNSAVLFSVGAIDPNGDSLVTEVINPLTGFSSCSDTTVSMSFASASPAYSLTTNPIQTGNSFSLNSITQHMSFTPTQTGVFTLTIKTKEYRNGILIGWATRDMQFNVLPCNVPVPLVVIDTNSLSGCTYSGGKLFMCAGSPLSFCWDVKSTDINAVYILDDNHSFSIPGATTAYTNQRNDSVRGCFSWMPGLNDTGNRTFIVTLKDSTCGPPWDLTQSTFPIRIYLYAPTKASNDTSICLNSAITLNATGGLGNYMWSVLGGQPMSLFCTACTKPIAVPLSTTQYEVVSANNICSNTRDTVTVTVIPVTKPNISITVVPGTSIPKGSVARFIPTVSSCSSPTYRWYRNGSQYGVIDTLVVSNLSDSDEITCELTCDDLCATNKKVVSNKITMTVLSVDNIEHNAAIRIYPNPNNGEFTLEAATRLSAQGILRIYNVQGQEVAQYNIVKERTDIRLPYSINAGIYIGRFTAGDKETAVLKIICNK